MSTTAVTFAPARLGTDTGAPHPPAARIGRVYVLETDELAAVLHDLGTQATVVAHEGLRTHVVRGTSRPVGGLRRWLGRPRLIDCGDVTRTELSLDNGTAHLDHELGTERVVVRTWSPRDGSELDQALWWHGHSVSCRELRGR